MNKHGHECVITEHHWTPAASKKIFGFLNNSSVTLDINKDKTMSQACLIAISIVLGVNGDKSPPSCAKPYDKMTACNLICNMIHDSDANSAMKMLQTKMESLNSMIKKPSSPQPGKKPNFAKMFPPFLGLKHFENNWRFIYFFLAVPASSCKQQYEKYK